MGRGRPNCTFSVTRYSLIGDRTKLIGVPKRARVLECYYQTRLGGADCFHERAPPLNEANVKRAMEEVMEERRRSNEGNDDPSSGSFQEHIVGIVAEVNKKLESQAAMQEAYFTSSQ